MLPFFASANIADDGLRDIELPGHFGARKITGSNKEYVSFGQFGPRTLFANKDKPTFKGFLHVEVGIAEMEMSRLNTNFPVTVMKNVNIGAFGDGSTENAIGGSVCPNGMQFAIGCHGELAISPNGRSCPIPTSFERWISRHEPAECLFFGEPLGATEAFSSQGVTIFEQSFVMRQTETDTMASGIAAIIDIAHKQGV
jgi:hypothetical protein